MKSDIEFIKSEMKDLKNLILSFIQKEPPILNIPNIKPKF